MIAPTTPLRAYGSDTPRTISQRVAPSASAPSFRSRGTARKSSRQTADVIGIDHDRQHDDRREHAALGRRSEERDEAEPAVHERLDVVGDERSEDVDPPEADHDARDRGEHVDERADRAADRARGASSLRKSPIAIESGAAIKTAPNDVIAVPRMNWSAPKWLWTGSQVLVQRNPIPNARIDGHEPSIELPDDRGDQRERPEAGERRQPVERSVAESVEQASRVRRSSWAARSGFHGAQLSSAPAAARAVCHHSVTERPHSVHPGRPAQT